MKAPPFEYACPDTIAEAVKLLNTYEGDAKLIAGGQSLLPILAFRLAAPSLLVDIRKLPGLDTIEIGCDGVRLGAKVRWCDIEADGRLDRAHPLLKAAVALVAHYQIRNRGTVGGSLAHADPAAELLGIAIACEAEIKIFGPAGERMARADEFIVDALSTCLEFDELVVEMRLPSWPEGRRWAFEEFARRSGDFAIAGIALYFDQDGDGRACNSHVGIFGAHRHPIRLLEVEALLDGHVIDAALMAEASRAAARSIEPPDDIHASVEYRRALVEALTGRALLRAVSQ